MGISKRPRVSNSNSLNPIRSQGRVASAQSHLDYNTSRNSSVVASAHIAPYAVCLVHNYGKSDEYILF